MCCKAMGVPDLKKPPGVWCVHAGDHPGGGCGIYESRPQCCREFNCAWLTDDREVLRDEDRPDRLGVVFWVKEGGGIDAATGRAINVIVAMERHAGAALQNSRSRQIIERWRRRGIAVSIGSGPEIRPVQLTRDGTLVLGQPPGAPPPPPDMEKTPGSVPMS